MAETAQTNLLQAALAYAARGWQVFPCHTPTKAGCSCRRECGRIGKHPRTQHGLKDATTERKTIERWWHQFPQANIGIATGAVSGFIALDEDTYKGGDRSREDLEQSYHPLPQTVQQLTGGGGVQYFFAHPGRPVKNGVETLGVGLDIRGDGGYIIAPPSLHASGRHYDWEASSHPEDTILAPAPAWLLALCQTSQRRTFDAGAPILAGARNDTLFRFGCSLRGRGCSGDVIYAALQAMNAQQCHPPLDDEELCTIVASCTQYDPGQSRNGTTPHPPAPQAQSTTPYGDLFYAEWLLQLHGDVLRYCPPWKTWLYWTGTHWQRDSGAHIMECARATMRHIGHQAVEDDNTILLKHYAKSMNHAPLTRMIAQASTIPTVLVEPTALDTHPFLLNCRNGTLDLRTGQCHPHDPSQLLTRCLAVEYDPDAACPQWQQFLWRIMGGSLQDSGDESMSALEAKAGADARAERLIGFLQRVLGYALTGDVSEECLFLLHGSGRNGKSKFLSTIKTLLGPYAKTADMHSFLHRDRETVRNDLADLASTRFVCASEVNERSRFAEGLIKQLTGTDSIKARFLFEEYFEFLPEFKLFLAFNHRPHIGGTDTAIWSRIREIPFTVFIPPEERDKHLGEKLCAELSGILAWMVEGCLAWQRGGLGEPEEVLVATEEYRQESDTIGQFLAACCYIGDAQVQATALYTAYKNWCELMGEYVVSQTAFGRRLTDKGFPVKAGTGNKQFRHGIGLQVAQEQTDRTEAKYYRR